MMPAQPPLPTIWNLPFQFSVGNHASILISESAEGFRVAATRQCAGSISGCAPPRPVACAGPPAPRPAPAGGRYGPAATDSTAVNVVSGSESDLSWSQGVWAKGGET